MAEGTPPAIRVLRDLPIYACELTRDYEVLWRARVPPASVRQAPGTHHALLYQVVEYRTVGETAECGQSVFHT